MKKSKLALASDMHELDAVQANVASLEAAITNMQGGGEVLDSKNIKKATVSGISLSKDEIINKPIAGLRIYGKTTTEHIVLSDQLADLPNKESYLRYGVTYSCNNGVVTVAGNATQSSNTGGQIDFQMPIIPGTYTISGSTTNVYVRVAISKADGTTDNKTSSDGNPKTFTLDGTETRANIYIGVTTGVDVSATIYPMLNIGSTALPFEQYQSTVVINNLGSGSNLVISDGENNITQVIESYGLPSLPLTLTSSTARSDFTWADDSGNIYLSDYIDFGEGLYYHNIGYIDSYNGEDIGSNYIAETYGGVTEGDKVIYVLATEDRYTTPIPVELGLSLYRKTITNNLNAWMEVDYWVEDVADNSVGGFRSGVLDMGTWNCREIFADGADIYVGTRKANLMKIDCTSESAPEVDSSVEVDALKLNTITGIVASGDYLYVVDRDIAPWKSTTTNASIGNLTVVAKADLSIVDTQLLPYKGTGAFIYKGYLYVPLQVYGLAIFDITTDPTDPVKVAEFKKGDLGDAEFQKCDFWSVDDVDYMVVTGFEHGLWFIDITDPTNPTEVGKFEVKLLEGNIRHQIFGCRVEYPYIYSTIAPLGDYRYCPNQKRGVLKFDISDLSVYTAGNPNDVDFEYAEIDRDDWWEYIGEGDNHPTTVVRMGDLLITNNGNKGFAVFRASDKEFKYLKRVSFIDNFGIARPMVADDGRLICATDSSNFNKRLFAIYRFTGVNY